MFPGRQPGSGCKSSLTGKQSPKCGAKVQDQKAGNGQNTLSGVSTDNLSQGQSSER